MRTSLLRKYGEARLPRYTSYPTAALFGPAVGPDDYAAWLTRLPSGERLSLYLHVPFCRSMCWYCGCHTTITVRDQPIADYLNLLRREVDLVAARMPPGPRVAHVHFGGGTPTIIPPADFIALVSLLRARFAFSAEAELAVEIDPRTLTAEMAAALAQGGVRRASLGVQSFDPVVQQAVNRIQSEDRTAEAVCDLRRFGISRINFDLIYGLPHQTVRSCVETARAAAAMLPDRLAVFGYAHVPSFKKHQRLIDEAALPDAAARTEQAQAIAETLVNAGYRLIGLDHFARPDDELARAAADRTLRRNFQGYTTDSCETLIGLGASAIGRLPEGYVQNQVPLGLYADRIASGTLATARGYRLTPEDRARGAVIERLMCDFEADVSGICTRYGMDPARLLDFNARLSQLAEDGVVACTNGTVRVRRDLRFLVRAAAAAFDAYLADSPRAYSRAS